MKTRTSLLLGQAEERDWKHAELRQAVNHRRVPVGTT